MSLESVKGWFARVGSVAVIGTVCGAIGSFGGYAALSYAAGQNQDSTDVYQIPYQGFLELGGQPVDGPKEFEFTLYASETSEDENDKLWKSSLRTLQVSRGYFATVLGDETDADWPSINSAILAEQFLYVGIKVDGVELSGRQRILAVPYAQNGMPGKTFAVNDTIRTVELEVVENADMTGTLQVNGATTLSGGVTGGLNVAGATKLSGTAEVTGASTLRGATHLTNSLRVDGNVTTGGTADSNKLIRFININALNTTESFPFERSTGLSTADWNCAIGSFRIDGDIDETGVKSPLLDVRTFTAGGTWRVRVNMAHNNPNKSKGFDVGVVCYSTKISHRESW